MSHKTTTPGSPPLLVTPSTESTTFTARPSHAVAGTTPSYGSVDSTVVAFIDDIAVTVDRPTTAQVSIHGYTSTSSRGRPVSFITPVHVTKTFLPSFRTKICLFIGQFISFFISSFFLSLVVAWASLARISRELPKWLSPAKPSPISWDNPEFFKSEKVVKDVQSYARAVGFDILDEEAETADGYYLRVHRVVNPRHKQGSDGKGGLPVLILHGLFQSSGSFITSEERSLAFWLSEQGAYQVFLGNTRGVFNMGHRHFSRSDPRFWDWTIRELAMYDLPALVDYVRDVTGYDKIAFIGHSQGNGLAFISLSEGLCPELGEKLSCFIALAPAVFAGPLTQGFPFTFLKKMGWDAWRHVFGVLDFIPLMRWSYDYVPPKIFAVMGYTMFAFLFQWTDANWLHRRKTKMFRFTPTPVSSASIFWWCGKGGFADRKCTMDTTLPRWFDARFPPLSIFHGGRDLLILAEPLVERIRKQEQHVKLVRVEKIDLSEHCDFYWAADAVEWCFSAILEDIEKTRPKQEDESQKDTMMTLLKAGH